MPKPNLFQTRFACLVPATTPRPSHRSLILAVLTLAGGSVCQAEGFRSPTMGTFGLGASGGRIVFVDDASAVQHNPANLADLKRWEVSFEPTLAHHAADFAAPGGGSAHTEDPWKFLPHLFAGGPLSGDRVALGMGISVPFGLSVKWDPTGAFRYTAPYLNQLETMNFNPTASLKLAENLYLGVGVDVMWSELTFKQIYPWSFMLGVPGLPDGEIHAKGDGLGWGANAGLTWQFHPRHRVALTVRTPMDVHYDGDLQVSGVPTAPGGVVTTDFASKIGFPTMVGLGYGIRLAPTVRVEANGEWIQFSRFDELPLETPQSLPGFPQSLRQDWQDTFTVGFAATWDFARGWALRAGYQYYQTPVPDYTFSPSIPDAAQNAVTVGLGYRCGRHRFEAAFAQVFYDDRQIQTNQNPAFVGRYGIDVSLFSLGYGFSF